MENNFYIYWHLDPRTNLPVYVGKGKGRRAWHLYSRNKAHTDWIRNLRSLGLEPIILIGNHFASEKEAYSVEKIEIDLLKKINCKLVNIASGGHGGRIEVCKKPIICLNNGKKYDSTISASQDLNISSKRINDVLKGRKKTYKGLKFRYVSESLNLEPDETRKQKEFNKKHTTSKSIICNETGKIYISITDAANELKVCNSFVCQHLNGKVKQIKGFTFRRNNQ